MTNFYCDRSMSDSTTWAISKYKEHALSVPNEQMLVVLAKRAHMIDVTKHFNVNLFSPKWAAYFF